jgi:hypothetical protein
VASLYAIQTGETKTLAIGGTQQYSARGFFTDGQNADLTTTVAWSVYPAIASITPAGLLTATSGGAARVTATYAGVSGSSAIAVLPPNGWQISVRRPDDGAIAGATLFIAVNATGPTEIASISASVAGNSTALTFFTNVAGCFSRGTGPCWTGTLSLAGVASGRQTLLITVTDVLGNRITTQQAILRDDVPTIHVATPTAGTVSNGTLQIAATCTDDGAAGCTSLVAHVCREFPCSNPVAQGTTSIAANVSGIGCLEGAPCYVLFQARDSLNQLASTTVRIHLETSTRLRSVAQAPGTLADADSSQLLYVGDGGSLRIQDRATGEIVEIHSGSPPLKGRAFLTSAGAAFATELGNGASGSTGFSWESGTLVALDRLNSEESLRGSGAYLIWSDGAVLYRRDVIARSTIVVNNIGAGNWKNSVAANGAVAFWDTTSYEIHLRQPDGTTVQLTSDATLLNTYPETDGTAVLYRKHPSGGPYSITLNANGSTEEELSVVANDIQPQTHYQIAAGWVAYVKPGPSGVLQVWRRTPQGQQTQLTFFSGSSQIDGLGEDGTITIINGSRRYWVAPGDTALVDVSSLAGKTLFIGGSPYLMIGNALLAIQ